MKFQDPSTLGSKVTGGIKKVCRVDKPKAIYPTNVLKVGGIITDYLCELCSFCPITSLCFIL